MVACVKLKLRVRVIVGMGGKKAVVLKELQQFFKPFAHFGSITNDYTAAQKKRCIEVAFDINVWWGNHANGMGLCEAGKQVFGVVRAYLNIVAVLV